MSLYEQPQSFQPKLYSWQTTQPCGTDCREVPDISANAGVPMALYANGGWTAAEGTSFAAPFMGGMVADADSGCGQVGLFTPLLYTLYEQGSYGTAFNDVTEGDTDLTGSNDGDFPALADFDAATGIGTPLAPGLACTQVYSVSSGYAGSNVTVSGLGLEHATIYFGTAQASVVSETATSAVVTVPAGSGTVVVSATGTDGRDTYGHLHLRNGPRTPAHADAPRSEPSRAIARLLAGRL